MSKIINFNEATDPQTDDLLVFSNTVTTKKTTFTNFINAIKATLSLLGMVKTSTANETVLGDNDPRLPTQSENDAMAGTTGTPSSSNKYITETDPTIVENLKNTGTQTVAGVKTFSSIPVSSAGVPTTDNEIATKEYADSQLYTS
jgi:hypothetical protein